jgi:hypothetical protein
VSAGLNNERLIARQCRQWLLDEVGKAEVSINACEFIAAQTQPPPGINTRPAILAIIRNTVAPSIALSMIAKV